MCAWGCVVTRRDSCRSVQRRSMVDLEIHTRTFLRTTELDIPVQKAWRPYFHITHITHIIPGSNLPNKTTHSLETAVLLATMPRFPALLALLSFWAVSATAQFGFFDQMFGNQGHQQQQQPQNVRSDSQWYQQQYEGGMYKFAPTVLLILLWTREC
jgi:hypothetical protein